jgi:ribonuclease P protein component
VASPERNPGGPPRRPESFRPESRIRKRREFLSTYADGRKAVGRFLVAFLRFRSSPGNRLGITVTRKFGGSVERNRTRRRIREVFRRGGWGCADAGPPHWDLVVNARDGAGRASLEELREDLARLVGRLSKGPGA